MQQQQHMQETQQQMQEMQGQKQQLQQMQETQQQVQGNRSNSRCRGLLGVKTGLLLLLMLTARLLSLKLDSSVILEHPPFLDVQCVRMWAFYGCGDDGQ
jgi:hypothetical protein